MASTKEKLEIYGIKKVLGCLESNPQENVPKVLGWLRRFDKGAGHNKSYDLLEEAMIDPDNNWNRLISSFYTDIEKSYRKKSFENMVVNFICGKRISEYSEKYNCNIPWAIIMDPTSACNLKCTGCWADEYGHKLSLSFEPWTILLGREKSLAAICNTVRQRTVNHEKRHTQAM